MNQFVARYYEEGRKILDLTVESWNEYIYTLKNSDEIKIGNEFYTVDKLCMNHDGSGKNGMVINVDVRVTKIDKQRDGVVNNVKNYYSR